MELWQIFLIIIGSLLVVLVFTFLIVKSQKNKQIKTNIESVKEIIELFGNNNILSVEKTQKRVRVEVKDLNTVDLEGLKPFTNGIFTIGNKVVVTFKENTDQIVKSLGVLK